MDADVISWEGPGIPAAEHHYPEDARFDFAVTQPTSSFKPLFAVEFDGRGDVGTILFRYAVEVENAAQGGC